MSLKSLYINPPPQLVWNGEGWVEKLERSGKPPSYYRYCDWATSSGKSAEETILCFEVPGDFDINDYKMINTSVGVVKLMMDGARRPHVMQHGCLARALGRDSMGSSWKPYNLNI